MSLLIRHAKGANFIACKWSIAKLSKYFYNNTVFERHKKIYTGRSNRTFSTSDYQCNFAIIESSKYLTNDNKTKFELLINFYRYFNFRSNSLFRILFFIFRKKSFILIEIVLFTNELNKESFIPKQEKSKQNILEFFKKIRKTWKKANLQQNWSGQQNAV